LVLKLGAAVKAAAVLLHAAACWLPSASANAAALADAAKHSSTNYCSGKSSISARVQDRLLRFAAAATEQLQASGQPVALVSRSGLELQRFGHRYSHAGISLQEGAELPWAVRQLYYACDEKRPRLFDQGLVGFVFGTDNSHTSFLSLVFLPEGPGRDALLQAAQNRPLAIGLVAERYSANAFAFSSRYQNCNQWLAELLGVAWGPMDSQKPRRDAAQAALKGLGYQPEPTIIDSHLVMLAASFIPMLNLDDHPVEHRQAMRLQVSMPATIEHFVRQREPAAQRIELCQTEGRIVIRRGWQPLSDKCQPEPGDEVLNLD
jgi:hypothetical protein